LFAGDLDAALSLVAELAEALPDDRRPAMAF
jgi:hypothetical protein